MEKRRNKLRFLTNKDNEENDIIKSEEDNDIVSPKVLERFKRIYDLYVFSELTQKEVSEQLDCGTRTVSRAISYIMSKVDLRPSEENLKIMLDKTKKRKQELIAELADKNVLSSPDTRIKYYSELRKNDELESKLHGLLKTEVNIDNRKVIVLQNIRGNNADRPIEIPSNPNTERIP